MEWILFQKSKSHSKKSENLPLLNKSGYNFTLFFFQDRLNFQFLRMRARFHFMRFREQGMMQIRRGNYRVIFSFPQIRTRLIELSRSLTPEAGGKVLYPWTRETLTLLSTRPELFIATRISTYAVLIQRALQWIAHVFVRSPPLFAIRNAAIFTRIQKAAQAARNNCN